MSLTKLRREIEVVNKALNIDLDKVNYRFSTWGEFNASYLLFLSEAELKQYWRLVAKFALIHADQQGKRTIPSIHGDFIAYRDDLDRRLSELEFLK